MSYQVTRVEFAGQPNRRVWIESELDDSIALRIKDLRRAPDARVRSNRCWPNRSNRTLFVFRSLTRGAVDGNLTDGSLMYVLGKSVQIDDTLQEDQSGELERMALEAMDSGELVRSVPCRRCDPNEPRERPVPCPCDSPIDLSEWNRDTVITHNNCYSFARRMRWCAGGQGSQPGNRVSHTKQEIRDGLTSDGLHVVTEAEVLGEESGDFVAFFLKGDNDYHFLRLDGNRWTHMPASYAATACDALGHPIPKEGAQQADMDGYHFLDYYRIPTDAPDPRCS
jgi:hypothetical protein